MSSNQPPQQEELRDAQFSIRNFRRTFYKSDEAIAAFKEVGIKYENAMWDNHYENFQRKTKRTPEKDRLRAIHNLKRLVIPANSRDKERTIIVHDMWEEAYDALGNKLTTYRGGLGCYHKPRVKREYKLDMETGEKVPVIVGIEELETCYSIPFSKENIDKLAKYVTGNTTFLIQRMGGGSRKITVDSFEDWKNGNVEEVLRFGHRASDYEKQVLADEKQGNYEHYKPPINPGKYIT